MVRKPETSINYLLTQISEIIDMIKNIKNPSPKDIPLDAVAQLNIIESSLPVLKKYVQSILNEIGVEPETMTKQIMESESDSAPKRLLKRSKEIENEMHLLQIADSKAKVQKKKTSRKKTKSTQEMKERRKMFKSIGGDQKWIPM